MVSVQHMVYSTWCTVQDMSHGECTEHGVQYRTCLMVSVQHMVYSTWCTVQGMSMVNVQHMVYSTAHVSW